MKKILILLCTVLLLCSCSSKNGDLSEGNTKGSGQYNEMVSLIESINPEDYNILVEFHHVPNGWTFEYDDFNDAKPEIDIVSYHAPTEDFFEKKYEKDEVPYSVGFHIYRDLVAAIKIGEITDFEGGQVTGYENKTKEDLEDPNATIKEFMQAAKSSYVEVTDKNSEIANKVLVTIEVDNEYKNFTCEMTDSLKEFFTKLEK